MGVQHGGAKRIVSNAMKRLPKGANERQIINGLYDSRSQYVRGVRLPPAWQRGVQKRYIQERRDVLRLINN